MRIAATLFCAALTVSQAHSDPLSAADREALIESLDALRESAGEKIDARFRVAITAYRQAMVRNETAIEFYLKCIEKVNFEDQQKKTADFREWKRGQADKLSDPEFRLALRYQLRWLVLALQASSEKADPHAISKDAQEVVDAIYQDADKLSSQLQTLKQPVTSTVFARAYDIENVEKEKLPLSPVQLDEFYNQVVFPPLRSPAGLKSLRSAWIKRIQQESIEVETWADSGNGKNNKGRRNNQNTDSNSANAGEFASETLPQLQWEMEMDLFGSGDESGAAKRMLAHIRQHLTHKSARQWGDEFIQLLTPKAKPETEPEPTVSTE